MKLSLANIETDNEGFIDVVENIVNKNIVNKCISSHQPKEIYLIKIDNWFDHKWLELSGKTSSELGCLAKIKAIQDSRFQIDDNRGGIDGWIAANSIYGKRTKVED